MLFVPSVGGVSHHRAEDAAPEDLAAVRRFLTVRTPAQRPAMARFSSRLSKRTTGQSSAK